MFDCLRQPPKGQGSVPLRTLHQMLVRPKGPVPVQECKGVAYSIPCVECSSVYISQTGRSLKQHVSEHRRTLKNAWGHPKIRFGRAFGLDMQWNSEVLDHHQHTTTLHVGELVHLGQTGGLEQGVRNPTGSTCSAPGLMGMYPLITLFSFSVYFFLLYIGFVSIVNNLTHQWCAWDHASCMCMGTPRTVWHVPTCAGVESGYFPFMLAFNIHLTAL